MCASRASGGDPPSPAEPLEYPRIVPLGDAALTVEFGHEMSPAINARVIAFADRVRERNWPGLLDVVPTFCSVTMHIDPSALGLTALADRLRLLSLAGAARAPGPTRHHRIPVVYGGEWGPDLEEVAAFAKLSLADAIALHVSVRYRVYMLGFTPGFPYLGIVPAQLAMPRLATPRISVPAGSVGIAGRQTGIYPTATPGGWRIIGRTPVALVRRTASSPFLLAPGDQLEFDPIGPKEFERLQRESHVDPR